MTYDLLIKNGRIIDGSGRPAFHGDVGVARGRIVELGRLDGPARRVIEADGRVVAPGFVDNHCHYDAQVLWDPLCTFSCHHGATSVVIGNCSLALAPVKAPDREKLAGMLRSEEHTSELQSRFDLVCRLLLEKKKKKRNNNLCLQ